MEAKTGLDFESPGQYVYDGIIMTTGFPKESLDRVVEGKFQLSPDDVLISSYPKAGTAWMQSIVSLIYGADDLEKTNSTDLDTRAPFLEFMEPGLDALLASPSPRFIKTHLPARFFKNVKSVVDKKTKIIYVMRNPRDTLVSFYHFYQMNEFYGCYKGTWDQYFELFKHDKIGYGFWFDIVSEWWEYRNKYNILFVKYEDLQKDAISEVEKIVKFLGKNLSRQKILEICEMSSYGSMSKNTACNGEDVEGFKSHISKYLRKGKVGNWKNYFSAEQNEVIDKHYRKSILNAGLEFDFEIQ